MSSIPLHYVDLRAFCYATEDDKRVEQALRLFLPEDVELDRVETTGHYGDRILIYSVRVERADEIRHVLTQLASLPALDQVTDELDDRVTDNTELFLTLDKQAAFNGSVRRGDGITVRGKLEAYPATREAAIENARDILSDLDENE
ncbi:putative exosome subunit [Halovivax ruber XH-70]|uniref:Putative exosome subunit n=1 Tax=Halovivax ruber (strain DSM 18193 / JCM 13892 / XH-70) TaxID=797302 RepID=L0IBD9_HALRX|nr:RNA-binding protein [Halovivax ruber]AGB16079.1 putative exosome subunit [Halovivax ruber XH-70]